MSMSRIKGQKNHYRFAAMKMVWEEMSDEQRQAAVERAKTIHNVRHTKRSALVIAKKNLSLEELEALVADKKAGAQ